MIPKDNFWYTHEWLSAAYIQRAVDYQGAIQCISFFVEYGLYLIKIHVGEIEIHILIVITLFLGTVHGLKPNISMVWLNNTECSQSHGNTTGDCWFWMPFAVGFVRVNPLQKVATLLSHPGARRQSEMTWKYVTHGLIETNIGGTFRLGTLTRGPVSRKWPTKNH